MRIACLTFLVATTLGCAASTTPIDGGPLDTSPPNDASPPVDTSVPFDTLPPVDVGVDCNHDAFPSFDRTCSTDSDCTVGVHQTDCCGTQVALGMSASQLSQFQYLEDLCEAQYPACGCASGGLRTDDGMHAPTDDTSSVIVRCDAGRCATTLRAATSCDGVTCSPTQVCVMECSGIPVPDGGVLHSHCVDVPPACATSSSCSCFGTTSPCPTGTCQSVDHGMPLCLCA